MTDGVTVGQMEPKAHEVPPPELLGATLMPLELLPLMPADAEPGYTVISASATPFGLCETMAMHQHEQRQTIRVAFWQQLGRPRPVRHATSVAGRNACPANCSGRVCKALTGCNDWLQVSDIAGWSFGPPMSSRRSKMPRLTFTECRHVHAGAVATIMHR